MTIYFHYYKQSTLNFGSYFPHIAKKAFQWCFYTIWSARWFIYICVASSEEKCKSEKKCKFQSFQKMYVDTVRVCLFNHVTIKITEQISIQKQERSNRNIPINLLFWKTNQLCFDYWKCELKIFVHELLWENSTW